MTAREMKTLTLDTLIKRINRQLAKDDQQLRVTRGDRHRWDLGDFYVVDVNRNFIVATHVDPEALGRELGALSEGESVEVQQ